jgi:hypothetical protein
MKSACNEVRFFHLRSNLAQSHAEGGRQAGQSSGSVGRRQTPNETKQHKGRCARGGFTSHFCLFIIMHEIMSSAKLTIMQFT